MVVVDLTRILDFYSERQDVRLLIFYIDRITWQILIIRSMQLFMERRSNDRRSRRRRGQINRFSIIRYESKKPE